MRSIAIVVAALIGCTWAEARAEPWLSSLGAELERATTVEVSQVEQVKGMTVTARIVDPIRSGRRAGEVVTLELGDLGVHDPVAGDRIVSVCDPGLCPRVFGVERDGLFRLEAGQEDIAWAAWISPAAVSEAGLRAMVAGRAAPPVCVHGTVELLDEAAPAAVDLRFDAASGAGVGTIGALQVRSAWGTRASVENFGDGAFVRIGDDARGAMLYTDHVRVDGGCLAGDFWWGWPSPLPRTLAGLGEALAGTFTSHALATGVLRVGEGGPLPAGMHALRFELSAGGEVTLASKLATGPITNEHSRLEISGGRPSFGVEVRESGGMESARGELTFVFATTGGNQAHHTAAQFVEYLAASGHATVDVLWVPLPWPADGHAPAPLRLGRATLTYVPERGPGRPRKPPAPAPSRAPHAIAR